MKAIFHQNEHAPSGFYPDQAVDGFGANPLRAFAQQMGCVLKTEITDAGLHAELRVPFGDRDA